MKRKEQERPLPSKPHLRGCSEGADWSTWWGKFDWITSIAMILVLVALFICVLVEGV